ncbi:MAG: N-acetylmuramic acid 6-phosphate etherase [Planctomycetes bacterium]|nr:N-acetylmuramic acid 6-phosphate etherase [Planctomycetota bacterium]MCB9905611.1 N-acetylmuramic acid 6-phosphate etherase [Planctomycetota bacterium]
MTSGLPADRSGIDTERANENTAELDALSLADAFDCLQAEDDGVARAVAGAKAELVAAVELAEARWRRGGRIFYVGAGTSGRLAALDAAELPPTFQTDPERVQFLIAGGERALVRSVEGAEDSAEAAAEELDERGLGADDLVLGIAAGGSTPYVHGALRHAREIGAATVFLACVPREQAGDDADVSIRLLTGPEPIVGSTRMKAGTATKLALNRFSTLLMVRLGKVHGNRMVDVRALANAKLVDRGTRLVAELTGLDREAAHAALIAADGRVPVAVLMVRRGLSAAVAAASLERAGSLRVALAGEPE